MLRTTAAAVAPPRARGAPARLQRAAAPRHACARRRCARAVACAGAAPHGRCAWLPTPPPSPATEHLLSLLDAGCDPAAFHAAAEAHTLAVAASAASLTGLSARLAPPPGAPPEAALAARISALRADTARAAEVEALLALSAGAAFAHARLDLHAIVPDPDAPPLARAVALETMPALMAEEPDAARELRAHVGNVLPEGADPEAVVRLDAASGARLYAGSVQFGYFVRSAFRALRAAGAAGVPPETLRQLASATRSQEAWGAAARRAGALWALQPDADGGFLSALSEFSTGVTLAPTSAVAEFYDTSAFDATSASAAAASALPNPARDAQRMPSASALRPLRAGALRDLVAEAALWGWHLAEAERQLADDPRTSLLLTPRQR